MANSSASSSVPANWGLLDAEAQNAAFPDNFAIPDLEDRTSIRSGDLVKLVFVLDPAPSNGPNAERMWVEVRTVHDDGTFDGWLTNRPVVISDLGPASLIAFDTRHIAGIAMRKEEVSFDVSLKAVVSRRALKTSGPPGWIGFSRPLDLTDSGWSVTAGDEPNGYFDTDPVRVSEVKTLGELAQRFPAMVEVFQAGSGEWVYRTDHRRYVRLKSG